MSLVRNSETLLELRKAAAIQLGREQIPDILGDRIIPVLEVNPALTKKANIIRVATSGTTVLAVPAGKSFNIVSAQLSYQKVAGDSGTVAALSTTDSSGITTSFLYLVGTTLTAEKDHAELSFSPPLETATDVTLGVTGAFTAVRGIVTGYFTDTIKN